MLICVSLTARHPAKAQARCEVLGNIVQREDSCVLCESTTWGALSVPGTWRWGETDSFWIRYYMTDKKWNGAEIWTKSYFQVETSATSPSHSNSGSKKGVILGPIFPWENDLGTIQPNATFTKKFRWPQKIRWNPNTEIRWVSFRRHLWPSFIVMAMRRIQVGNGLGQRRIRFCGWNLDRVWRDYVETEGLQLLLQLVGVQLVVEKLDVHLAVSEKKSFCNLKHEVLSNRKWLVECFRPMFAVLEMLKINMDMDHKGTPNIVEACH